MMPPIRTLVVDDERHSRDELIYLLKQHSTIEIIGVADSGEQAVLRAMQLQPDVIFLDVAMPILSGIEAAKAIANMKDVPRLVFVTANRQFGAEAFRLEAFDYLLKPLDKEHLADTVRRLEKWTCSPDAPAPPRIGSKLAVEVEQEIIYINPKDIIFITHKNGVTRIVTITREYHMKTSLKELESRMRHHSFMRIHKSHIVNLHFAKRLIPWFNGAYQLELSGADEFVSVSRNYVKAFRRALEL
ncbi:LytTR family DNA-binding domain-containing protein [Paenibacillus thiaminolyticus]|nr:LytTR family DNA-binding domain-containing protein [Paenibacillus thiaminolyticus]WCF10798.1 LytTR family DNA-binding domain-containing protein [Paenibacillus thiaminolyticus]